MEDDKLMVVRATREQITDFIESLLWKDMKREMGRWKRQFEKESISVIGSCIDVKENSASILTHLGDIHGRCVTIDFLLEMPDVFLSELEIINPSKGGE